jgi:hypothetical protein
LARDAAETVARLVERAREASRRGVAITLEGQRVAFWTDLEQGVRVARTIFGPYCAVRDVTGTDRPATGWRVSSAAVPSFAAVRDRLVDALAASSGPPLPVRRWAGDSASDRYDLGPGRSVVVHRQPFAGLTVFLGDERELFYLRSGAAYEVPHTEHVVKYPLRVALRQAGFSQVHAAACSFHGRGLLLLGPRRSGKSTLLLHLLNRGARFVASDFSVVHGREDGTGRMIAFPHMIRVARGTIGGNERLRESLSRHDRTGDYLREPVFNAGKEELYFPVLARTWGPDVICQEAPLDLILFPALDLRRTRAASARVPRAETQRRVRDTLLSDPPTLDWLPFASDAEFASLLWAGAEEVVRCAPPAFELRFGPEPDAPVAAVEKLLEAHRESRLARAVRG